MSKRMMMMKYNPYASAFLTVLLLPFVIVWLLLLIVSQFLPKKGMV